MRRIRVRTWVMACLVTVLVLAGSGFALMRLANARTFQVCGGLTSRVETSSKTVALTFDDGPNPVGTQPMLDVLAAKQVRATFFLTGRELEEHPELGRAIAAAGHEIGNHSYSHERMVFVTPGYVADEVERTDAEIRKTGYPGEITFRPPNGKKLVALPCYLSAHNRRTITWDIEPNSYPEVDRSAPAIAGHVIDRVRPGSIILLHGMYAGRERTREAIGPLIDQLRQRGYRFVPVSDLPNGR
jgi:peptidoglycan-N-acetylglucosamine deacetylase